MPYFAHPTQNGYAVCRMSYALGGAVAVMECGTHEEAAKIAALRNLDTARECAAWQRENTARTERRSVRSCLPDLLREH